MAVPATSMFDPRVPSGEATGSSLEERASWVDSVAAGAFLDSIDAELGDRAAAIAVGGYGRRELFPHSDIDILILVREDLPAAEVRGPVGRFVQKLWDA